MKKQEKVRKTSKKGSISINYLIPLFFVILLILLGVWLGSIYHESVENKKLCELEGMEYRYEFSENKCHEIICKDQPWKCKGGEE